MSDSVGAEGRNLDLTRLALVRDAVIEPIKKFVLRKSEFEWLGISVFSTLLLGPAGRFAIERAAEGKFRIAGMTADAAKQMRNVTPTIDLLRRYQKEHEALWNIFFVWAWTEFEAALDDIRVAAIRANAGIAACIGIDNAIVTSDEAILRKLRLALNASTETPRFTLDLQSLELLGFSALQPELVTQLATANQVRNVLAHRRGVVDSKALAAAPALKRFGNKIVLTKDDSVALTNATFGWANHLLGDLITLDKSKAA